MQKCLTTLAAWCATSVTGTAPAQSPPAAKPTETTLVLRIEVPGHFVGANASAEFTPSPGAPPKPVSTVIQGPVCELTLPAVPSHLTVMWSPRVRLDMPLPERADRVVANQRATPKQLDLSVIDDALVMTTDAPPDHGRRAFSGRFGGRVGTARDRTAEQIRLQETITAGIDWLLKQQLADGSWPGVKATGDCLATAAACLALTAAGNTFRTGPHAAPLRRALCWLVEATANDTGCVRAPNDAAPLEEQALLAMALSEALGLARFEPLRPSTEKALAALSAKLTARQSSDQTDAAALAFATLALISAREFQLDSPHEVLSNAADRLDGGDEVAPLRDAATMLVGQFLQHPEMTAIERRAPRLLANLPARGANLDTAYVLLGTLALLNSGEPHWSPWSKALLPAITGAQTKDGEHAGSWPPDDPRAQMRGRCWTTALRLFTLQSCQRMMMLR